MAVRPLVPFVQWPGLTAGVRSLTYTCSQGTTPGTAILVTNPIAVAPSLFGTLQFGAGSNGIRLIDCRVTNITQQRSLGGLVCILQIEDRRWRWKQGVVSGDYNQLDHHGKLVPWTIKSPTELALLCLKELGETNFSIDLPAGLTTRDGRGYALRLARGENFPDFGANPPTSWDVTSVAAALTQLAGRYGRRVFFDPVANQVVIAPSGGLLPIPFASLNTDGVSLSAKPKPRAVVAVGDYRRFQMKLALEAVGREWDGTYVPIDELSYAPTAAVGKKQVLHLLAVNTGTDTIVCTVDGKEITGAGRTDLRNKLQADSWVTARYTIAGTGSVADPMVFTHKEVGVNGAVTVTLPVTAAPPPVEYVSCEVKVAGTKLKGWATQAPADFVGAEATDRLTKDQAINLARESVYRCYRVKDTDVSGAGPIFVPGYGFLARRLQLILTANKVEQVKPEELDTTGVNLPAFFNQAVPGPYYNGHSQDQPAMVYGSYFKDLGSVLWNGPGNNTDGDKRVRVPFTVDSYEQLVVFSEPVYLLPGGNLGGVSRPCELVLECAVKVMNADTHQVERHVSFLDLGGPAPQHAEIFPDLIDEVVGRYDQDFDGEKYTEDEFGDKTTKTGSVLLPTYRLKAVEQFQPQQTIRRAAVYLDAMARQFQEFPAESVVFNGIFRTGMSSTVQQLTWEIGPGGFYTKLSANTEHDVAFPSWLARRLQENLPAIDQLNADRKGDGGGGDFGGTSTEAQRNRR